MTPDEARGRLEELRVLIDDVDRRVVELLNQRTRVVEDIRRVKRQAGLPIYEPKRIVLPASAGVAGTAPTGIPRTKRAPNGFPKRRNSVSERRRCSDSRTVSSWASRTNSSDCEAKSYGSSRVAACERAR